MKKLSFYLIAGLFLFSSAFTSCEKIAEEVENATEITVNTSVDVPFVATPTEAKSTNASGSFFEQDFIDINSNEDLKDYLDKIQSMELTSIEVVIDDFSPADLTLIEGTFSCKDNVTNKVFSFQIKDRKLVKGEVIVIDPTTPGWDIANEIIETRNMSTVTAEGTFNSETFEVSFTYSNKIKAVVKS